MAKDAGGAGIAHGRIRVVDFLHHMILYHSRDDEWVPFEHLSQYAEKLPGAITVPLEGRGHSCMKKEFSELVEDIVRQGNLLS